MIKPKIYFKTVKQNNLELTCITKNDSEKKRYS